MFYKDNDIQLFISFICHFHPPQLKSLKLDLIVRHYFSSSKIAFSLPFNLYSLKQKFSCSRFELGVEGLLPDHVEQVVHMKEMKLIARRNGLMTLRHVNLFHVYNFKLAEIWNVAKIYFAWKIIFYWRWNLTFDKMWLKWAIKNTSFEIPYQFWRNRKYFRNTVVH